MKLAEALAQRADLQKRLAQEQSRAMAAARYLEGEEPPESTAELLESSLAMLDQFEELVIRINHTNSETAIEGYRSLTNAIAHRDALNRKFKIVSDAATAASNTQDRYGYARSRKTELREIPGADVKALRAEADVLARQHRELDTLIQQANWNTELI